ncbi:MAG: hypothetical protein RBR87_09615 [Bacteroidales bacterium]|jgi:hypothetical protein|nr:hypothetical protein [Bacteroidales bacterium]
MTKTRLFAILTITLFLFIGFQACKKNENEEVSYQPQTFAAQNLLLQKHNIIQLTVSYFKALKNENLTNTGRATIDQGQASLNRVNDKLNYRIDYFEAVYDFYKRYRGGKIFAETDTLPLQQGAKSTINFLDFRFFPKLSYSPNRFSADFVELELITVADGHYIFEQKLTNVQLTDTSGTKTIKINGTIRYDWEKWPDSEWFSFDNEIIRIEANLSMTNHNGDLVEFTTSSPFTFRPNCAIVKGGSGQFSFSSGLNPDAADMEYASVDTICNKGARMQMNGMPFILTFDDWMLR